MKVKPGQVFNLMDTNGRRNDVINALQGYLAILDDILNDRHMQWANVPESLAQFEFYKQAIEMSPDVFVQHGPYDSLMDLLRQNPDLLFNVESNNIEWVRSHRDNYNNVLSEFDKGIEDRARHYTSNLVKLGFTDSNRTISDVGNVLLGNIPITKDVLEGFLPLNETNVVYLRQLLKLRIFSNDEEYYYSPFNMAILSLLRRTRISQNEFCELVQGINPCSPIDKIEAFIDGYQEGDIVQDYNVDIPNDIRVNTELPFTVFERYFKNQKTQSAIRVYYAFYTALYRFNQNRTQTNLNTLLTTYENEKPKLVKAFGLGRNIFSVQRGERPSVDQFLEDSGELFEGNLNEVVYDRFCRSKQLDTIREYSDTTIRIFKATGLISFDNGFVELAYRDLCEYIFDPEIIKLHTCGLISEELNSYYDCYEDYENGINSFFLQVHSLTQIMDYSYEDIAVIVRDIQTEFNGAAVEDIPSIIVQRRRDEFSEFIETHYSEDRVKNLLALFSDRTNDSILKNEVSNDATVPTIYEYVVGLAWYYFSDKTIDLLNSYNLTLSANFEPITHAGGGKGDIVIYDDDKVIMLEATLMNANSQKRGEWEPVLRHSVNLKVEEEKANTDREVTTFFIADSFDKNTINIWKAISSVPLESSVDRDRFTTNVIIMPINNDELINMIDKKNEYGTIIQRVRNLFIEEETQFDMNWRNKFINSVFG